MWLRSKAFSLSLNSASTSESKAANRRPARNAKLQIEKLEDRQMMTASPGGLPLPFDAVPALEDDGTPLAVGESFGLTEEFLAQFDAQNPSETIAINVPEASADGLVRISIEVDGESQTLVLTPTLTTRSSQFQVLVQGDDGELSEFQFGSERVYSGFVEERPGIQVSAVISERGLSAEAWQLSGNFVWEITPQDVRNDAGVPLHSVNSTDVLALLDFNHDHNGDGIADHAAGEHVDNEQGGGHGPGCACANCVAAFSNTEASEAPVAGFAPLTAPASATASTEASEPEALIEPSVFNDIPAFREPGSPDPPDITGTADRASRAVLFNPVQVREAVIGFDVTNESFREAYNSNVQAVLDNIALFLNGNERVASAGTSPSVLWLRDAAIRQVAGTIIIRTSQSQDPYADADGDANINRSLLDDFRDRWNSNADAANVGLTRAGDVTRAQSNHDFATLLGGGGTDEGIDGLAFVGQVGQSFRYSISDGSRVAFWRAVARHEIGHTWGLPHNFGRAESDPGGNGIGVMGPRGGLRNRLSTDEIIRITDEADEASSNLSVIASPAGVPVGTFTEFNVRPIGVRDDVRVLGSDSVVIDVLANDFDANNDPLFLDRYEATSDNGGTIELSVGTGDRGQDQLIYTPAPGFSGEDLFFYFVGDDSQFGDALTQYGAVSILVETNEVVLDPTATEFDFDFGPLGQVVFNSTGFDGIGVSPESFGDVFFTRNGQPVDSSEIGAFDRGELPNVNNVNRDAITSSDPLTVNFVVPNGRYVVAVNLADPETTRDNQTVSAEGELVLPDIDNPVGTNTTQSFEVDVVDGILSLDIDDLGGVSDEFALNRVSLNLLEEFAPPFLEGDFDRDQVVGTLDYLSFRDSFGDSVAPFAGADANGSGEIDTGDFQGFLNAFGSRIGTVALVNPTVGNGSFEDLTDATPNLGANRIGGNNSTATIPGFTAVSQAFGGFDDDNNNGASDGTQYAFVNSGGEITVTSDPLDHVTVEGERFIVSVDVGNNNGTTHDFELRLLLGGLTQTIAFQDSTNVGTNSNPGDDLTTFTLEYTATASDAGTAPVVEIFANNTGNNSQLFIDNVRLDVETIVGPTGETVGMQLNEPLALTAEDVPSFDGGVIVVNGPLRGATPGSVVSPASTIAKLTELDLLALTLAEETFGEIGEEELLDVGDEEDAEEDAPLASLDSALEQLESEV